MNSPLDYWREWLDSLNTDGGHIIILLVICLSALVCIKLSIMDAAGILSAAFGALLLKLKDGGKNVSSGEKKDEKVTG